MHYSASFFAGMATLLASVNGHMLMNTPKPYTSPPLDNGPLDPSGSNFPCKAPPGFTGYQGTPQEMAIGSEQPLKFTGSAVHGGGSCQVSITYVNPPPKDPTQWQVIYSVEGGCPAKGVAGNLPENPNGNGADTYTFKIPPGLKTGTATLAWTWFNKIGNREMYMNCAPVSITGGSSKREVESYDNSTMLEPRDATFPPMFTANIGNGCKTADSTDLQFPQPGQYVDKFGSGTLTPPVGTCQAGSGSGGAGGAQSSGAPAPSSAASSMGMAPSPAVFAPGASSAMMSSAAAPTTMQTSIAIAPSSAAVPSAPMSSAAAPAAPMSSAAAPASSAAASPPAGASAAGAQTPQSACTSEGMWNCLPGGKSFQQCASGQWSVVQSMAAGMSCTPGQSMSLTMAPGKFKRSHRHNMMRHGSQLL